MESELIHSPLYHSLCIIVETGGCNRIRRKERAGYLARFSPFYGGVVAVDSDLRRFLWQQRGRWAVVPPFLFTLISAKPFLFVYVSSPNINVCFRKIEMSCYL